MLVLCSVFIPVAFLSGVEGEFYRQFAITIAASTVISTLNSLTLSPALAAVLLRPRHESGDAVQAFIDRVLGRFFNGFNKGFAALSKRYSAGICSIVVRRRTVLSVFVVLLGLTVVLFRIVPTGFIPAQDKQYLIAIAQLPNAASLDRTEAVVRKMSEIAVQTPGVEHAIGFPGLSANGFVSLDNAALMFIPLKDFEERTSQELSAQTIAGKLNAQFSSIYDATVLVVPPPPVQGLGTTGGFKLYVQDRGARGYDELASVVDEVLNVARQQPELFALATYTTYQNSVPQLYAEVDRVKAKSQGIRLTDVFGSMQAYLGSTYVNDFNRFGRTFRVYAQADAQFRDKPEDVAELKARNANGDMVPLGSIAQVGFTTGPDRVSHYNVYLAADINGQAAPGYSSGQATAAMERVLRNTLPNEFGFEWTDLTYQQKASSDIALLVFALCVLLVFLILAAQYESWSLPLAIILIVPMSLLSAMFGVWVGRSDNNILTQIGFIVLVGLACKNAILIVEFARERVEAGMAVIDAAIEACRLRLRPILMTSFAFIMGVVPLVIASGAGSEMRHVMGIAVFAGMLGVTLFGLFLTPVFFVTIELFTRRGKETKPDTPASEGAAEHA
jgi:hydrophobe/amphiphile efflux-1 (HAE1) family protein